MPQKRTFTFEMKKKFRNKQRVINKFECTFSITDRKRSPRRSKQGMTGPLKDNQLKKRRKRLVVLDKGRDNSLETTSSLPWELRDSSNLHLLYAPFYNALKIHLAANYVVCKSIHTSDQSLVGARDFCLGIKES